VAAVASFAEARSQQGTWLVRMEDLDRPRERPGAARDILATLTALGLHWDRDVLYQSRRTGAYEAALRRLRALGLVYPCGCSRAEIARIARVGPEGPIYPGTCRNRPPHDREPRTLRLRTQGVVIAWHDALHGPQRQDLESHVGDFPIRRADGIHAYQLAVVVDDAEQGVTQVVRGADLLASTARQIHLQRALGLPTPSYAHVPLVMTPDGRKLSKSLGSLPVDAADPLPSLSAAWRILGQEPLPEAGCVSEFWRLALPRWRLERVPVEAHRLA
jgi:glutamyl-Q tRNA(Asp) synthetase